MRGNAKLNITALGLLKMALKLARVMASMARIWLYGLDMNVLVLLVNAYSMIISNGNRACAVPMNCLRFLIVV